MTIDQIKKSLRGGGCGQTKPTRENQQRQPIPIDGNQNNHTPDIILYLNDYLEKLEDNILKIGSPNVVEDVMRSTQMIIKCEKYFHLIIIENNKKVQETVNLALEGFQKLILVLIQLIRSQKFLAYQILKICNFFARTIFIYFLNNPKPPFEQEKQQTIQQCIEQIFQICEADGEIQPYSNQIFYELELISACVDTIPNDRTEGRDIGIKIFQEIISSVINMSPSAELFSALAEGAIFLHKENKKANQKEVFKQCFLLEQMKWQIILQIEKQDDVNKLLTFLTETYNKIIKNSSFWQVKYCWTKILSKLMNAQPLVTKSQFIDIKNELKVEETWKQLIQQSVIKPIGLNCVFGILTTIKSNSKVALSLQQQLFDYDFLQDQIMNGFLDVPSFEFYYKFISLKQEKNQQLSLDQEKYVEFIQQINKLPFQSISLYFEDLLLNFVQYYKLKQSLLIRFQQSQTSKEYLDAKQPILSQQISNLILKINQYIPILEFSQSVSLQLQLLLIDVQNDKTYQNLLTIHQLLFIFEEGQQFFQSGELINQLMQILHTSTIINMNEKWQTENLNFLDKKDQKLQVSISKLKQLQNKTQKYFESLKWGQQLNRILNSIISFDLNQQVVNSLNINLQKEQISLVNVYNKPQFLQEQSSQANNNFIISLIQQFSVTKQLQKCFSDLNNLLKIKQIRIIDYQNSIKQISNYKFNLNFLFFQSVVQYCAQQFLQEQLRIQNLIEETKMILSIDDSSSVNLNRKEYSLNFFTQTIQESTERLQKVSNLIKQCILINQVEQNNKEVINVSESLKQISEELKNIVNQIDLNQEFTNDQNLYEQLQIEIKKLIQLFVEESDQQQDIKQLISKAQGLSKFINDINNKQSIKKRIFKDINQIIKTELELIIQTISKLTNNQNKEQNEVLLIFADDQIFDLLKNISELINIVYEDYNQQRQKWEQIIYDIVEIEEFQSSLCQFQYSRNSILNQHSDQGKQKFQESLSCKFINDLEVMKYFKQLQEVFYKPKQQTESNRVYNFSNIHILECLKSEDNEEQIYLELDQEKTGLLSFLKGEEWRIRESFIFHSLCIQPQLKQINRDKLSKQLIICKAIESDFRVKATFKNAETLQTMNNLVGKYWDEMETSIQQQVDEKLKRLRAIQLQLQSIEKEDERMILLQEYKEIEEQIQNQSENLKDIGDALGFSIGFLKNIKKDLENLEQQLDKLLKNIEQMGQDIKFLRGKSPQQIFEIRMQSVLQNKLVNDANSVYVQLLTNEMILNNKTYSTDSTPLFNWEERKDGEVDEFLNQEKKESLLIHGVAGSGKSLAAQKIEEYMWIQYQQNTKLQKWQNIKNSIPLIPIFIQLPTLKDPKYSAVEETLKSQQYRFDDKQVNEFKEQVQEGIVKIIFIMDSYDELSSEYQTININLTNKLKLWKSQSQSTIYPKVITTSRTEAFVKKEYQEWFCCNDKLNLESFKEIKILQSIKADQQIVDLNKEQERSFKKLLSEVWSLNRFKECIVQMDLGKLLETPFMMNIVVEVLPNIYFQVSQPNFIKPYFLKSYIQMKESEQLRKYNREYFHKFWIEKDSKFAYPLDEKQKLDDESLNIIKNEALDYWEKLISSNFFNRFDSSQSKSIIKENLMKKMKFDELIANEITNCLLSYKLFVYDFYQQFFNQYVEQQIRKLQMNLENINFITFFKDVEAFSLRLSILFMNNQETGVDYKQKGLINDHIVNDNYYELFDENDQHARYKQMIKKCIPLKIKGNYISFIHKSLQEFLFAKYNIDILKQIHSVQTTIECELLQFALNKKFDTLDELFIRYKSPEFVKNDKYKRIKQCNTKIEQIQQLFKYIYMSATNQVIWSDHFYLGAIKFLARLVENDTELFQSVLFLIKLSAKSQLYINCSSNAIQLLAFSNRSLINQDFKGIQIKDVQLIGLDFRGCDLSETQFENINMTGMNLNFTNLTDANWTNVITHDLPVLKDHDHVMCFVVSPDSKIIITGGGDSLIIIWDAQTGNQIGKPIKEHSDQLKALSLTIDGQKLASADSKLLIFWSFSGQKLDVISKFENEERMNSLCFSIDGNFLFLGTNEKIVVLNVQTYQKAFNLEGHQYQVNQIAFAQNGQFFASAGNDSFIIIWDAKNMTIVGKLQHNHWVMSLAISSNCKMIVGSTYNDQILLWDVKTQQILYSMKGHTFRIPSVSFSPDDKIIVSGGTDNAIRLWDSFTGKQIGEQLFGHSNDITQVLFSPNGYTIISSSKDGTIRIWDAMSRTQFGDPLLGHKGYIYCAAYSKDGQLIASGGKDSFALLWNAQTAKMAKNPFQCNSGVVSISFSNDSKYICCGSENGSASIFSIEDCKLITLFTKHHSSMKANFFTSCDEDIISGGEDMQIFRWNKINTEIKFKITTESEIRIMDISKQGNIFCSSERNHNCYMWDSINGNKLFKLQLDPPDIVDGMNFTYDDQFLVLGLFDHSVRIFSTKNGEQINSIKGHNHCVQTVQVCNNQKIIISGCYDSSIKFWKFPTLQETFDTLISHSSWIYQITTSPNGYNFLSCSADSFLKVWDISEGTQIIDHIQLNTNWILSISHSVNGKYLYTGGRDGNAGQWNLTHGNLIKLFNAIHKNGVIALANSSADHFLATGGEDGEIFVWNIQDGIKIYELMQNELGKIACLSIGLESLLSIAGDNNFIIIWQLEGQIRLQTKIDVKLKGVYLMQFLQQNSLILTCIKQEGIYIWNCNDNTLIVQFKQLNHIQYITVSNYENLLRCLLKNDKSYVFYNIDQQKEADLTNITMDEFHDPFLDERQLIELFSLSLMPTSKTKTQYAYLNKRTKVISRTGHNLAKIWFKGDD